MKLLSPELPFFWVLLILAFVFGGRAILCPEPGQPDPHHMNGTYQCPGNATKEEQKANTDKVANGYYANPLGGTTIKQEGNSNTYTATAGRTVKFTTQADGSIIIEANYGMGTVSSLVSPGGEAAALASMSTQVAGDPYFATYLSSLSSSYPAEP